MHKSFGNCKEGDLYVVCGFLREADEFVPILDEAEECNEMGMVECCLDRIEAKQITPSN